MCSATKGNDKVGVSFIQGVTLVSLSRSLLFTLIDAKHAERCVYRYVFMAAAHLVQRLCIHSIDCNTVPCLCTFYKHHLSLYACFTALLCANLLGCSARMYACNFLSHSY